MKSFFSRVSATFIIFAAIPFFSSLLYYGFIASDVYISESKFVVRSNEKQSTTPFGTLLRTAGFSSASEEVRVAEGYIGSRDALKATDVDGAVRRAFSHDHVSFVDRFNPLGLSGSAEDLYSYYRSKVAAKYDTDTGIITLSVRAFSPTDAQLINARLLAETERLVNSLNQRAQEDLVGYAEREAKEAQRQAQRAEAELANYRNSEGLVDPEREATLQLQLISRMQDQLLEARMQLIQIRNIAPDNPQIASLQMRVRGLENAIAKERNSVAGAATSLSASAAAFQRLLVQREFADKQLAAALAGLQSAKNDSMRQRAYVERIAQPSLPDDALEPRRFRSILAALILSLIAWAIGEMMLVSIKEHRG